MALRSLEIASDGLLRETGRNSLTMASRGYLRVSAEAVIEAGGLPRRGRRRYVLPDGRVFFDPDLALLELYKLLADKPLPVEALTAKPNSPMLKPNSSTAKPNSPTLPPALMAQVIEALPELIEARPVTAAPIDPQLISVLLQRVDDEEAILLLL